MLWLGKLSADVTCAREAEITFPSLSRSDLARVSFCAARASDNYRHLEGKGKAND